MDYGIIFIIIIVILIIIAIILIIYANRSNVTNILASFPSYRIQCIDDPTNSNNYIALRNISLFSLEGNEFIPRQVIDFYTPFVYSGTNNTDPSGIWKIENLSQNNKIPITSGSEVYIVNNVYYLQTNNQTGYLTIQEGFNVRLPIKPTADIKSAAIFIYNIVGVNLFTLHLKNDNLPIIINRTNNGFVASTNPKVKPSVFKLNFQSQPTQQ